MDQLTVFLWPIVFVLINLSSAQRSSTSSNSYVRFKNSNGGVQVNLNCGFQRMDIVLNFTTAFVPVDDWIVIGDTRQSDCRRQVLGSRNISFFIPLSGEGSCGTKQLDEGAFENTISIRQKPMLILSEDEQILIRCLYGPPEVAPGPVISDINSITPEARLPFTNENPSHRGRGTTPNPKSPNKVAGSMQPKYIYLIVFLILILALLFLLCGCLYFFLKRRKVRVERRKKLLLAVPPGSELGKMGLGGLWWPGKTGQAISNDALLSHDYMMSSNSTRDPLSVSTDYVDTASPSTSTGSGGSSEPHLPPKGPLGYSNHYIHDAKHMIPRAHIEQQNQRQFHGAPAVLGLQSIPEERLSPGTPGSKEKNGLRRNGNVDIESVSGSVQMNPMYAHVDLTKKHPQNFKTPSEAGDLSIHGSVDLDSVGGGSKVYRQTGKLERAMDLRNATEGSLGRAEKHTADNESISTLEGKQYFSPKDIIYDETTTDMKNSQFVLADVHTSTTSQNDTQNAPIFRPMRDMTPYVRAVEQHKGKGPNKLSDDEISKWRHVCNSDHQMQLMITGAKTLEDFEMISHHSNYEHLFSGEKWAIIVQSLAHVAFMRKLSDILDQQTLPPPPPPIDDSPSPYDSHQTVDDPNRPITPELPPPPFEEDDDSLYMRSMPNDGLDSSRERRYIKKHEQEHMRKIISQPDLAVTTTEQNPADRYKQHVSTSVALADKQRRIFTRESYNRVKVEMESVSGDESSLYRAGSSLAVSTRGDARLLSRGAHEGSEDWSRDRSTWEVTEIVPGMASPNQGAGVHENSNGASLSSDRKVPTKELDPRFSEAQRRFQNYHDRSQSETVESPPQLSVYVGNVQERSIKDSVKAATAKEGFYHGIDSQADLRSIRSSSNSLFKSSDRL